eukprot:scaffold5063_cov161-Prasinococcus_capsulatus_cf.AAC.1
MSGTALAAQQRTPARGERVVAQQARNSLLALPAPGPPSASSWLPPPSAHLTANCRAAPRSAARRAHERACVLACVRASE